MGDLLWLVQMSFSWMYKQVFGPLGGHLGDTLPRSLLCYCYSQPNKRFLTNSFSCRLLIRIINGMKRYQHEESKGDSSDDRGTVGSLRYGSVWDRVQSMALTTTEEPWKQQLRGSSNGGRASISGKETEIDATSAPAAWMVTIATSKAAEQSCDTQGQKQGNRGQGELQVRPSTRLFQSGNRVQQGFSTESRSLW